MWLLSFFVPFSNHYLLCSNLSVAITGTHVYRARMTMKLAELKQELNTALLKVI
jgi:hypothetical protein